MPLQIIKNNIENVKVDVVVNPTNHDLIATSGADFFNHQKIEKELDEVYRKITNLKEGEVFLIDANNLNTKYVIYTVTPTFDKKNIENENKFVSCYKNALELAKNNKCESIAFPLISSDNILFPKELAFNLATKTIREFLLNNEMDVYLVIYDEESEKIANKLFDNIEDYVNKHYKDEIYCDKEILTVRSSIYADKRIKPFYEQSINIDEYQLDESWQECLFRLIDTKGIDPVVCYKRANVNKQLFSKINSNSKYRPSKSTALAFAIALKLNVKETKDMLEKAGFALSRSDLSDVIVEAHIKQKIYDIDEINLVLLSKDLKPLNNY